MRGRQKKDRGNRMTENKKYKKVARYVFFFDDFRIVVEPDDGSVTMMTCLSVSERIFKNKLDCFWSSVPE